MCFVFKNIIKIFSFSVEWKKVPIYWAAQYIGAFAGAACVFAVYIGKSLFPIFFKRVRYNLLVHYIQRQSIIERVVNLS